MEESDSEIFSLESSTIEDGFSKVVTQMRKVICLDDIDIYSLNLSSEI